MKQTAVIGAGSWGTALALVLADNGLEVDLWARSEKQAEAMHSSRRNMRYLPGVELPEQIKPTASLETAVKDKDMIVLVVPTKAVREVLPALRPLLKEGAVIAHASKGIEPETHLRVSEVIAEELPGHPVACLSGPSHAEEVCKRQPTTVTSSSLHMETAELVQDVFMNTYFRVYTNPDLTGVEIGGSLKNIIAIGSGMTSGLGFGDNARAALMTRGLAEISRLGVKLGADPLTFSGLSGLGDLIVTCTSYHSRNWRAGNMIGKGMTINQVETEMGMVVEGVRTTKAAQQLAEKLDVEMPITSELYAVLFENKDVEEAVEALMGRVKKHEMEAPAVSRNTNRDPLDHFEP
ncbi:NAD(P)H-dependent glycerol-3-phosphate dehydrogenase [Alkalicoccus urumqiensis]|uniref:Glycerol-3-phosphate dehydrogenase [NAD(P)+] n=1 Tax=Alkalicoccus urumqiensis TaxID=1548213 RepID=A0A2P6MKI6_ALKUR|nr:NAD(P)H-dependent glycerol-3-phosphate dehydrogenase [Alkalicoccus urumqiensis]PRO66800.1 NAD(P)H-dependent glycerol-3-phosphate dehydrogenase [Alkalicoccus urumqiensis]